MCFFTERIWGHLQSGIEHRIPTILGTLLTEILELYTLVSMVLKRFTRVTCLPLSSSWMLTRALRRCWRLMKSSRCHFSKINSLLSLLFKLIFTNRCSLCGFVSLNFSLPTAGRDPRQEALHTSQVNCWPQEVEAGWEFREGEPRAKKQGEPSQSELWMWEKWGQNSCRRTHKERKCIKNAIGKQGFQCESSLNESKISPCPASPAID